MFPEQGSGKVLARFQEGSGWVQGGQGRALDGTVPERIEHDLVADRGTGFRNGSLGEPVAVALVPALVLKGAILRVHSFVLAVWIMDNVLGRIRSVWKVLLQVVEGFWEI